MENLTITKAEKSDMAEILRLQRAAYQSEAELYNDYSIQPLTQTPEEAIAEFGECVVLKAVIAGEIVGSVRARESGGTVYVGKLMVSPQAQNMGIGKRLLKAIEGEFRGRRYELHTGFRSEKNIAVYEKSGYKAYKTEAVTPDFSFVYMEKIVIKKEFPILEFDNDKNAFIKASDYIQPTNIPENCVLCFFAETIENILSERSNRIAAHLKSEGIDLPVYELEYNGGTIALVQAGVGAPWAAAQIEELTALGCRKYIACGGCGVLQKDIAVGRLIIPTAAIRDEGTSYHYIEPAREISANERVVQTIEHTMIEQDIPYIKGKTWTTDAFYRETPAKIKQRKDEGCITVEMETSAFIAVSQYLNVGFGQILYAGDDLSKAEWDRRNWDSHGEIRKLVLKLALDACQKL